jgi:hypothetical protein
MKGSARKTRKGQGTDEEGGRTKIFKKITPLLGKVILYTAKQGVWKKFGKPEYPRPMASIILKEGVAESVLEDISKFRKNSEWYRSLGIFFSRKFYGVVQKFYFLNFP